MSLTKISALIAATVLALGFTLSANAEIKLAPSADKEMTTFLDSLKDRASTAVDYLDPSAGVGVVIYAIDRAGVSAEGTINLGAGIRVGCEGEYTISDSNSRGTEDFESLTCFGQLKIIKSLSLRVGGGKTNADNGVDYDTIYVKGIAHLNNVASDLNLQVEFGAVRDENEDDSSDSDTNAVLGLKVLF